MPKFLLSGRLLRLLLSLLLLQQALTVALADPLPGDALIGYWLVDSRDAIIHIDAAGDGPSRRYFGRIAWLKDDRYHATDGPTLEGKPVMDLNNPDPGLRNRPMLGLRLLWDLRYEDDHWIGGRIYDSDHGRSFDCTVQMKGADHLKLHAYVLHVPLFGGSTVWTRTNPPATNPPAPAAAPSG